MMPSIYTYIYIFKPYICRWNVCFLKIFDDSDYSVYNNISNGQSA